MTKYFLDLGKCGQWFAIPVENRRDWESWKVVQDETIPNFVEIVGNAIGDLEFTIDRLEIMRLRSLEFSRGRRRRAMHVSELTDEQLETILNSKMPDGLEHLNEEIET